MKRWVAPFFIAACLLLSSDAALAQRSSAAVSKDNPAALLEQARHAIEARLIQRAVPGAIVTAAIEKRIRRITIDVTPVNKNPRDDASAVLTMAWQPALQRATAFDEIRVRVGDRYMVTCGRRPFADPTISLWGDGLTRTCTERRIQRR